jgi:nitrogen fixation/metabolism regulation signal transduction histidine kinase
MAIRTSLVRWLAAALVALTVLALSFAGLFLASDATVGRARLGPYYPALLTLAAVLAGALALVIVLQLARLLQAWRRRLPGARLNARLVMLFVALSLLPALLVFGFAINFLFGAVDSRFAAPVSSALDDALDVGRLYLEERLDDAESAVTELAETLALEPMSDWPAQIDAAIERTGALQVSVFARDGATLANSSADPEWLRPETPAENLRLRVIAQGAIGEVESRDDDLVLRAVALVDSGQLIAGGEIVQAVFAVPARYAPLARRIESASAQYRQLEFLRDSLKLSMAIILGLVLLLVLLAALLIALRASRRLVTPVARLSEATRDIASGEFGRLLPVPDRDDELGDLVVAFNRMTGELDNAQRSVRENQTLLEAQRAYLDAVLTRISSAVVGVDGDGRVRLLNVSAERLLDIDATTIVGRGLDELCRIHPDLSPFFQRVAERARATSGAWNEEVRIDRAAGASVLLLRGSSLMEPDGGRGHLIVFDDASAISRAQREAAWAEVARRLAHEIKNPLTPIQLAAERLRRRYLGRMPPDDAEVLERATGTIVSQVESLKNMVNAFADYARPAPQQRVRIGLNALINDVLELYAQDPRLRVERALCQGELLIRADPDRLRQVLHNLIKNAVESMADAGTMRLSVATADVEQSGVRMACVEIRDHGPGLPADFDLAKVEPYRSEKPRGSGLGLVIVQRIVEEHGGTIDAGNAPDGGALFRIWLPE